METQKFTLETGVIGDFAQDSRGVRYQKYIVNRINDSLVWHAGPAIGDNVYHREIARDVGARCVIGGGRTRIEGKTLVVYDYSGSYGSVSDEILEAFAPIILPAYQQIEPELKKVEIR